MEIPEQSCSSFSDILDIPEEFLFNPNEDDDETDFIISDIFGVDNKCDNHDESGKTIGRDNREDDGGDENKDDNGVNNKMNIVDEKQNNNDICGSNNSYTGHKRAVKQRKTIRTRQKRDLRHKLDANVIREVCHWQRNFFKITKKPAPLWTGNCPKQTYLKLLIDKIIFNAVYKL